MNRSTSSDYFKLFVKREGKVVLGNRLSNLWLLTAVLTLTFLAIAFSNASLKYLSYKMNDPFINWVDIVYNSESQIDPFLSSLNYQEVKDEYHIVDYQVDRTYNFMFYGNGSNMTRYPYMRFFGSYLNNPLITAILDEKNVVGGCSINPSELNNESLGVIITQELLSKLGYDRAPAFIDICRYSKDADTLGFVLDGDYARIPVPVAGVVKRLPSNADIIASRFFFEQQFSEEKPFNLNKRSYATSLHYFVPREIAKTEFMDYINRVSADTCYVRESYFKHYNTYVHGYYVSVSSRLSDEINPSEAFAINDSVIEKYGPSGVIRVFDMKCPPYNVSKGSFISIQFRDLKMIHEFEEYASQDKYKIRIEMSQINAKENFNAVTIMANILSWAIIVFSIICIILFVVNLLQSYFQKVKRNLGTFKAFGISNLELTNVYMLIMFATVLAAITMALLITFTVQLALPLFGLLKDGVFNYLALWNMKTLYSIIIIVGSSLATVYMVMKRLLSATPGDLIYDRQ